MKKSFLLLTAGCFALSATAQQRQIMNLSSDPTNTSRQISPEMRNRFNGSGTTAAHKTTSGGDRWYNYGDAIDAAFFNENGVKGTDLTADLMWKDTLGITTYTTGPAHVITVSAAEIFDPKAAVFNHSDPYSGKIFVASSNAYVVDSIALFGFYEYNTAKSAVVDTLRVQWVTGAGGSPGSDNIFGGNSLGPGGHYGTDDFLDIQYDSTINQMVGAVPAKFGKTDVILNNSGGSPAWGDTDMNGNWARIIPMHMNCDAGALFAYAVEFISGDPATHGAGILASLPGDSLRSAGQSIGGAKYNLWRPIEIAYIDPSSSPTAAVYAPYLVHSSPADNNAGLWKTLPNWAQGWDNVYIPLWAWTSSGGPSFRQFQYSAFHVTCASCGLISPLGVAGTAALVNSVDAYPNPSADQLNVSFTMNQPANVSVSLSNVMGQVVSTQDIASTANGKAVFNISALPAGVYIYAVTANGQRSTGRVVLSH